MTERDRKLGVGVIGLGVGEQHARTFAALEGCELRWLFDLDPEQASAVRERLGAGEIAGSYEDILQDGAVDIVSIATFDHLHFDQVKAAFEAGKHVFVEKPLCRTAGELDAVKEAWEKAGKPHLWSNLVLRQAPLFQWLKNEIDGGRLGDIYAFDGDYLYGRLEKITKGWRSDVPDYSTMEGGGIHLIDLMIWLCGERPSTAATEGSNIATRETDFGYNDFMATIFRFPSGLVGRITANFGCMHPHQHVVRVFGTKATFIYDDQGPRLLKSRDEGAKAESIDADPLPDGKGVLIPDFVDAILKGRDPAPAAVREFDLISATAAATDAVDEGGAAVEISYLS